MKRLIVTDSRRYLEKALDSRSKGAFFIAAKGPVAGLMRAYLSGRGLSELSLREASERHAEHLKREYSKSIALLNGINDCLEWWAMNFTDKNPLLSPLFNQVFYSYVTMRAVEEMEEESVFILVCDDPAIVSQLKALCAEKRVCFFAHFTKKTDLKQCIMAHAPAGTVITLGRVLIRKILTAIFVGRPSRFDTKVAVVMSQYIDRTVGRDGLYREFYMPGLQEMLRRRGLGVVTAGFDSCNNSMRFLMKLGRNKENKDVYPIDYFIRWRDLGGAVIRALRRHYFPCRRSAKYIVDGMDFSILLKREMRSSVGSGQFLINLVVRSAAESLARQYECAVVVLPFENRSWEKMVVLAFRYASPATRIIGYQHAAITPNHINFLFEDGECRRIPFPDMVVTMGPAIERIMTSQLNVPKDLLKSGCALRQRLPASMPVRARKKIETVLVALASSLDEYVSVMEFFSSVLEREPSLHIVLRPHPAFSLEDAIKQKGVRLNLKYEKDTMALNESICRADAVVYVSSTVSIEALALGAPVINLSINGILSSDPPTGTVPLKWTCSDPDQFIAALKEIEGLSESDWGERRKDAYVFAQAYCAPVSENFVRLIVE